MPLLALGQFVFEIKTAPYEELRRRTDYRWGSQNRIGAPPSHQFMGRGEDTITLQGTLYPEITGGPVQLEKLREMGDKGETWILMSGAGNKLGHWFIESVEETQTVLFSDGTPRKIQFTLQLKRDDTEDAGTLGRAS